MEKIVGSIRPIKWKNYSNTEEVRYNAEVNGNYVGNILVFEGVRHRKAFVSVFKLTDGVHSSNTLEQAKRWMEKEYIKYVKKFLKVQK